MQFSGVSAFDPCPMVQTFVGAHSCANASPCGQGLTGAHDFLVVCHVPCPLSRAGTGTSPHFLSTTIFVEKAQFQQSVSCKFFEMSIDYGIGKILTRICARASVNFTDRTDRARLPSDLGGEKRARPLKKMRTRKSKTQKPRSHHVTAMESGPQEKWKVSYVLAL